MSDDWVTRQTLLERARSGDDDSAWEEFVGYYDGFINVIMIKMGVREADRADLKQDILLNIWRDLKKMERGKNNARFRAWLGTVIRNKTNTYFQGLNRRLKREDTHAVKEDLYGGDLEKFIEDEWASHMINLVMEHMKQFFSGNAIDVFLMTLDNKPIDEISDKLDMTKESIYVLRNRVKHRFQKEMQELVRILEF